MSRVLAVSTLLKDISILVIMLLLCCHSFVVTIYNWQDNLLAVSASGGCWVDSHHVSALSWDPDQPCHSTPLRSKMTEENPPMVTRSVWLRQLSLARIIWKRSQPTSEPVSQYNGENEDFSNQNTGELINTSLFSNLFGRRKGRN